MWNYTISKDVEKDYQQLDGSQKIIVLKLLKKLKENPLPKNKGGYGTPLGNDCTTGNLSGLMKLKAKGAGIRVVYELFEEEHHSQVIVIGMREDKEVYKIASKRRNKKQC